MGWYENAKCRGEDTLVFFPVGHLETRRTIGQVRWKYCNDCPVRQECYDTAEANNEVYGIWGGMSFLREKRKQ